MFKSTLSQNISTENVKNTSKFHLAWLISNCSSKQSRQEGKSNEFQTIYILLLAWQSKHVQLCYRWAKNCPEAIF